MTEQVARRNWLAVASADHVARGVREGFMQVSHGKLAPLRRIGADDLIVYYSPSTEMGVKDGLQSFTAIGRVRPGDPYQGEMSPDVAAFRRDVEWFPSRSAAIRPLLAALAITSGHANWGYRLRFGLQAIGDEDLRLIATVMGV
ncbi:MAG TPA: EVE domain-containing protein, partial [Thermomicrobiales bacterium]|nr:EVE domain-containing protein [Thermomicrobiales bacterium]